MSELQKTLTELHRELAQAHRLEPGDRAMLESAAADIQRALGSAAVPGAVSLPSDPAESGLAAAVVRLEAGHPALAAAVRAVVDALAKAGI